MSGGKRAALIALATAPIAVVIFGFVFMARSELAFDESRCPFRPGETRTIATSVVVREEARHCQDGVEEHRFMLLRQGHEPIEIGRRRLDSRFYGTNYNWSAELVQDRVVLTIRNPGVDERVFREAAPDAGRQ